MITLPLVVDLFLDESKTVYDFSIENNLEEVELDNDVVIEVGGIVPIYTGDYDVTPTDHAIVLNTKDLELVENVVVNPIPSNWGRIGWNGSYLTVS